MKKRFLALWLCIVLAFTLFPNVAFAQNAASVWIAGVELTSATPYYYNGGAISATDTGYNAYYNTATGVLSLNGLTVRDSQTTKELYINNNTTRFAYAICADGDITINLISDSIISTAGTATENENIALGINGNLTIKGSGSLTATSGGGKGYSAGVDVVGALTAKEGTLTGNGGATSGRGENFSVGIYVQEDLNISGSGSLIGKGGAAAEDENGFSTGIYALDAIVTSGSGSLIGKGGAASTCSHGIYSQYGNIELSVKQVKATGGEATDQSYGICTENTSAVIRVSDGNFIAKTTSTASVTKAALNKALTRGNNVTVQASLSSDGSDPIAYSDANYSDYLWVSAFRVPTSAAAVEPTHSYSSVWKSDKTNHWHECTCGEKANISSHDYGEWIITKDATTTENGSKERSCSVCGYKEKAVIVATGASVQTGDVSNIALWLAFLFVSGGIIMTLGVPNRKRREQ